MAKKPNIRFAGFEDDWEQRKLGEVTSLITKGTTPKDKSGLGEINFIKVENINPDNGEIENTTKITAEEHEGYLKRSQLKEDDILFSIAGTLGRVSKVKSSVLPANTNQALAIIRLNEGVIDYITIVLKGRTVEDFIKQNPTIGAQPNLSLKQVSNLEIPFPNNEEQGKIGNFFQFIDRLITLHQRKCDEVKKVKKIMLQKMFPKKGEKNPEIRFNGFTNDWEQRKLGEVCVRVTRKNKNNESDLPLTIASQYGLIDQRDFFNKVIAAKDMSNYYLLKKGEFAYNKSYSKGFDYGSIKRLNAYEQGCLSTLYICFSIETDEVDSDYLECFFDTLSWYHDVSAICAEGARNHGLLNVDVEAFFKDVNIEMPSQIQEQRKISVFINTLDHLITLHQRKCEELKNVKKYMLQNMFAKGE